MTFKELFHCVHCFSIICVSIVDVLNVHNFMVTLCSTIDAIRELRK